MALHRIEDDLRDHRWYERLFVATIADVEEYVGRWAEFEEAVARPEPSGRADRESSVS